jgi:hypothetical protein
MARAGNLGQEITFDISVFDLTLNVRQEAAERHRLSN